MKKLLIVTAGRPNGNSEVLAKAAAMEAMRSGGIEVSEIRLQSLKIKPCIGCEACMNTTIAGGDGCCVQRGDDFRWLFEQTIAADGILVAAPIYNLMPPGVLINVLNRAIGSGVEHQAYCNTHPKAGAVICVGGSDWIELALPATEFSLTRLAKGTITVDKCVIGWNSVKGMVVLDDAAVKRAEEVGRRLADAMKHGPQRYEGGVCPGCHNDLMKIWPDGHATCAICGAHASVEEQDGKAHFIFEQRSVAENRLTVSGFQRHLQDVDGVHQKAEEGKALIQERLKVYRAFDPVITPQR